MIWDLILKIFDPLIKISYDNYENNYLFYGGAAIFILLFALIGYLIYKGIT